MFATNKVSQSMNLKSLIYLKLFFFLVCRGLINNSQSTTSFQLKKTVIFKFKLTIKVSCFINENK